MAPSCRARRQPGGAAWYPMACYTFNDMCSTSLQNSVPILNPWMLLEDPCQCRPCLCRSAPSVALPCPFKGTAPYSSSGSRVSRLASSVARQNQNSEPSGQLSSWETQNTKQGD